MSTHHRLAQSPVGEHALVEAAVAWTRLRPAARAATGTVPRRHLPIVDTTSGEVAARTARLLCGLTWAILTTIPGDDPAGPDRTQVAVPAAHYHRVQRALTAAWRDTRQRLGRPVTRPHADTVAVALALWRMELLLAGQDARPDLVYVRAASTIEGTMVTVAARVLGLTPTVDDPAAVRIVALYDRGEIRRLLHNACVGTTAPLPTRMAAGG